jgi:hypothetical protein
MKKRSSLAHLLMVCLLVPLPGCAVVADLFNPNFVSGFGLSTTTIGDGGVTIVAFSNRLAAGATLRIVTSETADFQTGVVQNFEVPADPDRVVNQALFCPLGIVTFGVATGVEGNVMVDQAVAVEVGGDMPGNVAYIGQPLIANRDFLCGDVISVEVSGNGEATQLVVRVVPSP